MVRRSSSMSCARLAVSVGESSRESWAKRLMAMDVAGLGECVPLMAEASAMGEE